MCKPLFFFSTILCILHCVNERFDCFILLYLLCLSCSYSQHFNAHPSVVFWVPWCWSCLNLLCYLRELIMFPYVDILLQVSTYENISENSMHNLSSVCLFWLLLFGTEHFTKPPVCILLLSCRLSSSIQM